MNLNLKKIRVTQNISHKANQVYTEIIYELYIYTGTRL